LRDIEKQIREHWFKNHKVTLTQHGDLQVLQWQQEGTNTYMCRYVFDGNKMYISGDIGTAVFWLTWRASVHSFNDTHVGYFAEKLSAYEGKRRDYDGDQAAQEIRDWRKRLNENRRKYDRETMRELIDAAKSSSSQEEWAYEHVNGTYNEFIRELDCDFWEWIYDIGNVMPARIHGYLIGLKMASEQLSKEEVNEQLLSS
jgi:hypothetical protein